MKKEKVFIIVNFGGPRHLDEVEEFLICLLRDQEVLRTPFPAFIHNLIFTRVARKRAKTVQHDYATIGGKSPIFEDTEEIARKVASLISAPVLTFHRYLPKTHVAFFEAMRQLSKDVEIRIFPMFGQFSYATTGSIAKWFMTKFDKDLVNRMTWMKSYPVHPGYIAAFENCIREFLQWKGLKEEKTILLFSAHGVPKKFVATGDVYQRECEMTFGVLKERFPQTLSQLSYQSQFGKEEWIKPYTSEISKTVDIWGKGRENVVVVPLSFTSDHIETLFEVEQLYMPDIAKLGFHTFRCPALNQREDWLQAIVQMLQEEGVSTQMLIRK